MAIPSDLIPRVGVALVGGPLVLGAIYLGGWTLGAVAALAAAVGATEYYRMARERGQEPFTLAGAAGAGGLVLLAVPAGSMQAFAAGALALILGLLGLTLALSLRARWPDGKPADAVGSTLAGALYVGLPMAFLPALRGLTDDIPGVGEMGPWVPMAFVLFPLLTTWASDSAAYFVGSWIGRRKLAPAVSPGKSVEGAVGGLLGAVGAAVLMSSWWLADLPELAIAPAAAAAMGAVISVAGQTGDLVESMLKRDAGVKDSGSILPGHGGILDRLDALLWAFPVMWGLIYLEGML